MNIFYTNDCPVKSANNLCLVHVNKMISESAQMLSAAHHSHNSSYKDKCMKPAYTNHPSTVWVRSNSTHYTWLVNHMRAMCKIWYTYQNKNHGSERFLDVLMHNPVPKSKIVFKRPPVAGEERFKAIADVTLAYKGILTDKYTTWVTRTDKKRMPVKFPQGFPKYLNNRYKKIKTIN